MPHPDRSFAALLDDLFGAADSAEATDGRPSLAFDYLAVAEELHSGAIRVTADAAAAYADAMGEPALADEISAAPLPPADPQAIAAELGLAGAAPAALGALRRRFALANHPDRVAPHLRERAMLRMQIANMLIDEAARRARG